MPELDANSGIIYLSGNNIKDSLIDLSNVRYCTEGLHLRNLRSSVKRNSVLMSIVGTVGKASIVNVDIMANTDRNVATIKDINEEINPFFLSTFLNCKYGNFQTKRFSTGNVQPLLNLSQVKKIIVPYLTLIQKSIEELIKKSHSNLELSKSNYNQAEQTLLQTLNLHNWQSTQQATAVKSFSNSFAISGRLDAEYYQPKYDELLQIISNVNHKNLGNIATFKKSIEPGSDAYQTEGIPFIRVSDISKFGLSHPEIHLDRAEFDIALLKPKKDAILLSKDGSVGIAYKVEQDLDVITSSALLHLTITDTEVLPDYLTLVLNSKLTQMQAERDAGGSIIQHWRPDEIKQVLIPILPMETQIELSKQIKQSFKLRQESTKLIDIAKQAVEIAIEQSEEVALQFIKANTA